MRGTRVHFISGRVVRVLAALAASTLLAGCAGVHLHRPADEDKAKKAQAALEDAQLSASIGDERAVLERMLARDLQVVRRNTQVRRDSWLRYLVGTSDFKDANCTACASGNCTWSRYLDACLITSRANDILDATVAAADRDSIIDAAANLPDLRLKLQDARDRYVAMRRADDPDPSCPVTDRPPAAALDPTGALGAFGDFERQCRRFLQQKAIIESYRGAGALGKSNTEIIAFREAEAAAAAEVAKLTQDYKDAKKRYQDALKAGNPVDIAKAAKELRDRLDTIVKRAADVSKLPGGSGLAQAVASLKMEKETLDTLLDALADEETSGADKKAPADPDLVLFAHFVQGAQRIANLQQRPPITPLLLRSEHLRLAVEAAERRVANVSARIELVERRRDALAAELELLNKASKGLADYGTQGCRATTGLVDDLGAGTPACRERAIWVLMWYVNSWTVPRAAQEEIDYRILGLRHLAVVDQSEVAFAQWENLLSVPVGQLVDYHSSGIRPQDIANLINALGLGAIGYGVNH